MRGKKVDCGLLRVIDVAYIKDYELLLKFNDGVVKKVDLLPYLTGDIFPLLTFGCKFALNA